jgi:hypothetical protein
MKTTRHKTSKGIVEYTKEQKALDIAALLLRGFTKSEAENLVNARYK